MIFTVNKTNLILKNFVLFQRYTRKIFVTVFQLDMFYMKDIGSIVFEIQTPNLYINNCIL